MLYLIPEPSGMCSNNAGFRSPGPSSQVDLTYKFYWLDFALIRYVLWPKPQPPSSTWSIVLEMCLLPLLPYENSIWNNVDRPVGTDDSSGKIQLLRGFSEVNRSLPLLCLNLEPLKTQIMEFHRGQNVCPSTLHRPSPQAMHDSPLTLYSTDRTVGVWLWAPGRNGKTVAGGQITDRRTNTETRLAQKFSSQQRASVAWGTVRG